MYYLIGKIVVSVTIAEQGESVDLLLNNGEVFRFHHTQDCCESVYLDDVCGSWDDIVGEVVLKAEKATSSDNPPADCGLYGTFMWTFYHITTFKGTVTLTWRGESNGYYNVDVKTTVIKQR